MRIVGGQWRGRRIESPEGTDVTRPTTDRNREALASMVLSAKSLDLSDTSVLDAFAGSGAMGLELLSRGAKACTFIDRDRGAVARIRRNCRALGASPASTRVIFGDAQKLASRRLAGAPFGVVFLDPPYALDAKQVSALVEALAKAGNLQPDAVIVYERTTANPSLELSCATLAKTKSGRKTSVDLFRAAPHEEDLLAQNAPATEEGE